MKNSKNIFRSRTGLMLAALGSSVLLGAGVALADTLQNDLDASVDASLENVNLVRGGADGTVRFSVNPADADGVDGCNLSAGNALTVDVHSSNPAVAAVSPATLNFTNCTDVQTVSIHPLSAGMTEVTLTQTANASAGSFNLSGAAFVATVVDTPSIDTTPPVITPTVSPAPNVAGWNGGPVTVTWSVSDPESAIVSQTGCQTRVRARDTSGTRFVCRATSAGGTSRAFITVKIDTSAPRIAISSPVGDKEYEQDQEVYAHWSAFDGRSGIMSATGTVPSGDVIDTSTVGPHTFSVTAVDKVGNTQTKMVQYTVVAVQDDEDNDSSQSSNQSSQFSISSSQSPNSSSTASQSSQVSSEELRKLMICHKGGTSISIALPALHAHLLHGDTIGRCSE